MAQNYPGILAISEDGMKLFTHLIDACWMNLARGCLLYMPNWALLRPRPLWAHEKREEVTACLG